VYSDLYQLQRLTGIRIVRNCAFHARAHKALLSPESTQISAQPSNLLAPGIDVLPYLLLPLAGPEEYDLEVRFAVLRLFVLLKDTTMVTGPRKTLRTTSVSPTHQEKGTRYRDSSHACRNPSTSLSYAMGEGQSKKSWSVRNHSCRT